MKKVLFLGAAIFQVPAIQYALDKGYHVLTADNRPKNPGHRLAHQCFNLSTLDKSAILELAKREQIDGILAYASDVSMPTVAYVAKNCELPGNPMTAIQTLVDKALFRQALNQSKIQLINYQQFAKTDLQGSFEYAQQQTLPIVIKPTQGSGSRGVTIVYHSHEILEAIQSAIAETHSNSILIENFKQRAGKQVCGDGFMQNGQLKFFEAGDGHVSIPGHLVPCAETFPSTHSQADLTKILKKTEQILDTLGYRTGVFNLDAFMTVEGEPFIVEIGPRSGGNFIPQAIFHRTGVDLVAASVECAIDPNYQLPIPNKGNNTLKKNIACYMVHSHTNGLLNAVHFNEKLLPHIVHYTPYVQPQEPVYPFTKGSRALGHLLLTFEDANDMRQMINEMPKYVEVELT